MTKIAIDAMGGDFGPTPIVEGVIEALKEKDFKAILVGNKEEILSLIPNRIRDKISIVESSDVILMKDNATNVFKRKDSSIYKAIELVKNGEASGIVSAGHSGATMSLATLRIGRVQGILRPAIAAVMPTSEHDKMSLLLDAGANIDCKSEHLYQFALMGESYAENVMKLKSPRIGLLSNGEEETKGNEVTKDTFKKLKEYERFIGNVEGSDIFNGECDVIVCDGFIGNLVLKTSEGVADSITKIIKNSIRKSVIAKAGAILMRKVFKILKKSVDYAEYGGAPLLGIKGCVIVAHGKSNSKAIKNAIFQAITMINSNINENIIEKIDK
jgi:glycerol-3-phosphate acyltransferase PlsX